MRTAAGNPAAVFLAILYKNIRKSDPFMDIYLHKLIIFVK